MKRLNKADYVGESTTIDPDTGNEITIAIFKHQNGGMFAIDSSYLEQCFDTELSNYDSIIIPDLFSDDLKKPYRLELVGL